VPGTPLLPLSEALYGEEFFRAAHSGLEWQCYPGPEFSSSNTEVGNIWIYLNIPVYKFGVETSVMDPTFKGRPVDFWTRYMQEIDRRR
jgi:hypothetical protein